MPSTNPFPSTPSSSSSTAASLPKLLGRLTCSGAPQHRAFGDLRIRGGSAPPTVFANSTVFQSGHETEWSEDEYEDVDEEEAEAEEEGEEEEQWEEEEEAEEERSDCASTGEESSSNTTQNSDRSSCGSSATSATSANASRSNSADTSQNSSRSSHSNSDNTSPNRSHKRAHPSESIASDASTSSTRQHLIASAEAENLYATASVLSQRPSTAEYDGEAESSGGEDDGDDDAEYDSDGPEEVTVDYAGDVPMWDVDSGKYLEY